MLPESHRLGKDNLFFEYSPRSCGSVPARRFGAGWDCVNLMGFTVRVVARHRCNMVAIQTEVVCLHVLPVGDGHGWAGFGRSVFACHQSSNSNCSKKSLAAFTGVCVNPINWPHSVQLVLISTTFIGPPNSRQRSRTCSAQHLLKSSGVGNDRSLWNARPTPYAHSLRSFITCEKSSTARQKKCGCEKSDTRSWPQPQRVY